MPAHALPTSGRNRSGRNDDGRKQALGRRQGASADDRPRPAAPCIGPADAGPADHLLCDGQPGVPVGQQRADGAVADIGHRAAGDRADHGHHHRRDRPFGRLGAGAVGRGIGDGGQGRPAGGARDVRRRPGRRRLRGVQRPCHHPAADPALRGDAWHDADRARRGAAADRGHADFAAGRGLRAAWQRRAVPRGRDAAERLSARDLSGHPLSGHPAAGRGGGRDLSAAPPPDRAPHLCDRVERGGRAPVRRECRLDQDVRLHDVGRVGGAGGQRADVAPGHRPAKRGGDVRTGCHRGSGDRRRVPVGGAWAPSRAR